MEGAGAVELWVDAVADNAGVGEASGWFVHAGLADQGREFVEGFAQVIEGDAVGLKGVGVGEGLGDGLEPRNRGAQGDDVSR